jgi:hypothetical protein
MAMETVPGCKPPNIFCLHKEKRTIFVVTAAIASMIQALVLKILSCLLPRFSASTHQEINEKCVISW